MLHPFQRRHSLATNRNQVRCHYTLCDPAQSVCELLAAQVLDLVLLQRPRQLLVQEPEEALLLLVTFPSLRAGVCRLGVGTLACKCTDACQWHMTEARSFLGFLVFLLALLLAFVRLRSCTPKRKGSCNVDLTNILLQPGFARLLSHGKICLTGPACAENLLHSGFRRTHQEMRGVGRASHIGGALRSQGSGGVCPGQ